MACSTKKPLITAAAALTFLAVPLQHAAAQEQAGSGARQFTVTVENVSTPGLLTTDRLMGIVPLSPGAFAVFEGEDDPAFTLGEMADSGTRLIAEDGFPAPQPFIEDQTEVEILKGTEGVLEAGVFAAPGGTPDKPGIFPGETATFSFTASEGQRLQIETMFVQSDDWFFAFGDGGLELFPGGEPIEGDVTEQLLLFDSGTELDAPPGEGPRMPPGSVQKPVQGPMETNVGTDEEEVIQLVRERFPDFSVPENSEVIRVSLSSTAAGAAGGGAGTDADADADADAGTAPQGGVAAGAGGTAEPAGPSSAGLTAAGLAALVLLLAGSSLARRRS